MEKFFEDKDLDLIYSDETSNIEDNSDSEKLWEQVKSIVEENV